MDIKLCPEGTRHFGATYFFECWTYYQVYKILYWIYALVRTLDHNGIFGGKVHLTGGVTQKVQLAPKNGLMDPRLTAG